MEIQIYHVTIYEYHNKEISRHLISYDNLTRHYSKEQQETLVKIKLALHVTLINEAMMA